MTFKFLSTLLKEADGTVSAVKDYDGQMVCPAKIGDAGVGIGAYDMKLTPHYQGQFRSGRQGSPDNWQEDEHPEFVGYEVNCEMIAVLIVPNDNVKFEIGFITPAQGEDIKEAASKMVNGEVVYNMYEGNEMHPSEAPQAYHAQLFDTAKGYLLNNDCYSETIASKHL